MTLDELRIEIEDLRQKLAKNQVSPVDGLIALVELQKSLINELERELNATDDIYSYMLN
jgi:hypothetical protein